MPVPAALRNDVRFLGNLLGEVLRQSAGQALFDRVEQVRKTSKRARGGDADAALELDRILSELEPTEAFAVARAFAMFLTLANIAETHYKLHKAAWKGDPDKGDVVTFRDTFATLLSQGVTPDELYDVVTNLRVELVLTAHPTQVVRRSLLQRYNAVAEILDRRDRGITPQEEIEEELRRELTTIWDTDEVARQRPTPLDEVRGGLAVLEQELWRAVPLFLRQLDRALYEFTGRKLDRDAAPIRFGSWMGGDRDGNPNVTPDITIRATQLGRWTAADLLASEVDVLRSELSMRSCNDELRAVVGAAQEPYREHLRLVRERLLNTRDRMKALLEGRSPPDGAYYARPAELREALLLCYRSLTDVGQEVVARGRLLDLIRRVECFGLNMARLDIRQESSRHTEVLDAVTRYLSIGSYEEWDEAQRIEFLVRELNSRRPLIPQELPMSEGAKEVLDTFRMAAELGPDALGAYVISMARSASDVLAVELLQKAAGNRYPQRVVPLFETIDDLHAAGRVMNELFEIPWYRERIGTEQEIMIGYSDSAKDGGRLAANWALYQAQEEIVRVCKKHGVKPTLFHGRGGTVARGGGPTHLAIQSQPPGSISGRLRVTEQGEMIQAKFGNPDIAVRTLEIYTAATVHATIASLPEPEGRWRELITSLADTSCARYREVVRGEPRFVEYFRHATPELELGMLNIGSRPARRKKDGGIASLRAIPWIFAWTQNRLCLPSWLGVGAALDRAIAEGREQDLREMYERWPFFRATLGLIEMVVAKADVTSAERYDQGLVPAELHPLGKQLRQRLLLTIERVLEVSGHERLLEDYPEGRHSLAARDPYMDPINVLQVELLRRLRKSEAHSPEDATWDAFVMTVNGIAAGMRNTG